MKKGTKYIRLIISILILSLMLSIYGLVENNWIEVENNKVEINNLPKELNGFKIAHISDVHLPKNASNIDSIIEKVKEQKPDIIVMTGDIIDEIANIKTCGLDKLCKGLSEITKTYAVTGNHEYWSGHAEDWTSILTANDIDVMDNKVEIYNGNRKSIAIVGLKDDDEFKAEKLKDIDKIKGMPMILLAHRPELIDSYASNSNSVKPDIVFSGHAHGGQFRIPFINKGLIAPNQGFFPKYTSGVYTVNNVKMIVSRGLGNSIIPIRINNRPNLPIIELVVAK